jgi:predicted amidophosphoribosyltransferase
MGSESKTNQAETEKPDEPAAIVCCEGCGRDTNNTTGFCSRCSTPSHSRNHTGWERIPGSGDDKLRKGKTVDAA